MPNRQVHWHEGMFLRPQHMQAAERHWRESLNDSEEWFHPFGWGLRSVEIDRDAVRNGFFNLRGCEARFRDGTKVSIPADGTPDPVELKSALNGAGVVTIYLAVPAHQPGRSNVAETCAGDGPRYYLDRIKFCDENTGEADEPIVVRQVRMRLLLSGQDESGYVLLPLARVMRSAQAGAPSQIDDGYVPPLLAVDAWPPLDQAVQSLTHQLSVKVDELAEQTADRAISFDSKVPGDAGRMLELAVLNGALARFESVAFLAGLTPLAVYQELCGLLGQLAIFSDARRPARLPRYNHTDIGGCFTAVLALIQRGLETIAPPAYEKRYFERHGDGLHVALEPAWLGAGRALYLGVETELTDDECSQLLRSLDMKLGSSARVEQIFTGARRGLRLVPVSHVPRPLPPGPGIIYYQIERDPVYWRDVTESRSLAAWINLTDVVFKGDRVLKVVRPRGDRPTHLEFALYIV
jgi:type VI secretion system protein ImpJ